MNFFKRQIKTKVCLIKTVELSKEGWDIRYHTEVNGVYVSNSISFEQGVAEAFFEKVLSNKGKLKSKEILREAYL